MLRTFLVVACLILCACTTNTETLVIPTLVEFPTATSAVTVESVVTIMPSATSEIIIQPLSPQTVYAAIYAQTKVCPRVDCDTVLVYQSEVLELRGVVSQGQFLEGSSVWFQVARGDEIIFIHENSITFRDATPIVPTVDWRQEVQPVYYGDETNSGGSNVSRGSNNSSSGSTNNIPANCDEARAMGLSAQEAARAGLDRDRDGVACYGD